MSILLTPFYPIIVLLPLIGYIFIYWIYKYLLLRQSKVTYISYNITLRMVNILNDLE